MRAHLSAALLTGGDSGCAVGGARPTFNRADIRAQRANMTGKDDGGRRFRRSGGICRAAILAGTTQSQSPIPSAEQSGR